MTGLAAPDPGWPAQAAAEADRWRATVSGLIAVHHIGSTAVPGLPAKPILDLMPVFADTASADAARSSVEALGYDWMGPYGLEGRRYCRRSDPHNGVRLFHAHAYVQGHADIRRHLAFRDALLANGALRAAYTSVKAACAVRHPDLGADYGACKSGWINKAEARALEIYE